ncbi:MAG: hypothetical protein JNN05_00040 [Candidatus Omnitrophica bacterium]|nr:hypothetical protein [Candidatus Omnitrophota bacterium]
MDGVINGMAYNVGYTVGSTIASWSYQSANTANATEDSQVFFAGTRIGKEGGGSFFDKVAGVAFSVGQAILDPGPFNHTGIGAGGNRVIDSHPEAGDASGPGVRDLRTFGAYQHDRVLVVPRNSGLTVAANSLATNLQAQNVHFSMPPFSSGGVFCSQFTGRAMQQANTGTYGIGPNSQSWYR